VDKAVSLVDIELSRLRLDVRNPRLPVVPDSQRDALGEMSEVQGQKLLVLCKHIALHGLNPTQRFIVIEDDPNSYIVLDGNRRLTALRALEHPDLAAGHLLESELRQLKQLAASYSPLDDVPCAVFARREDAETWIALSHEGELDGAGAVPWTSQQKARHRARSGTKDPHLQVLEFVHSEGSMSAEASQKFERGKYPVSTLERALTTPYVRRRLGIEIIDGQVVTRYPQSEVLKGLTKLVDDIGTGAIKVASLMSVNDRVAYIDGFKDSDLPASGEGDTSLSLSEAPPKSKAGQGSGKDKKKSTTRLKLIPHTFSIPIPSGRINDIFLELKRQLRVDDVPNAAGVLLRVFLELSIDDYIEREGISMPKRDRLADKVDVVVRHMDTNSIMTRQESIPVLEAVKGDNPTLTMNLNALVHNRSMAVSGTELKNLWTRLERFFQAMWRVE
jgi:hypothetical protein